MSTLPMDIIETIIYEIYASAAIHRFRNEFLGRYPDGTRWAKGDGTASQCLAACCLISKSCYPRSRYFLYRRIDLAAAKTTAVLIRSLIANPSLGQFIHTLVLWGHTYHDTAICYNAVLSLIGKVPLLHTLVLGNIDLHDVHPDWYAGLSTFKTVQSLIMCGAHDIRLDATLRLLTLFPDLKEFTYAPLYESRPVRITSETAIETRRAQVALNSSLYDRRMQRLGLRSLDIRLPDSLNFHYLLQRLMKGPETMISELRRLVWEGSYDGEAITINSDPFVLHPTQMNSIHQLLDLCRDTLGDLETSLSWLQRPGSDYTLLGPGFDLQMYPVLETLSFNYVTPYSNGTTPQIISHFLTSITSSRITQIFIHFKYALWSGDTLMMRDWEDLDLALTASNLRTVRVVQVSAPHVYGLSQSPGKFWQSRFPRTIRAGLLHVFYGHRVEREEFLGCELHHRNCTRGT